MPEILFATKKISKSISKSNAKKAGAFPIEHEQQKSKRIESLPDSMRDKMGTKDSLVQRKGIGSLPDPIPR